MPFPGLVAGRRPTRFNWRKPSSAGLQCTVPATEYRSPAPAVCPFDFEEKPAQVPAETAGAGRLAAAGTVPDECGTCFAFLWPRQPVEQSSGCCPGKRTVGERPEGPARCSIRKKTQAAGLLHQMLFQGNRPETGPEAPDPPRSGQSRRLTGGRLVDKNDSPVQVKARLWRVSEVNQLHMICTQPVHRCLQREHLDQSADGESGEFPPPAERF